SRASGGAADFVLEPNALVGRRIGNHVEHDRCATKMRDLMPGYQFEDCCWLDLAQADLRRSDGDNRPRIGPAAAVEHRESAQIHAVIGEPEGERIAER